MNVYERIVELLKQEPMLQDFKYVKSKYSFVKRIGGIKYTLELRHNFLFTACMSIMPSADVTFDVLEKWWARYDFVSPYDRRNIYTTGINSNTVGFDTMYVLAYDGSDFDELYPKVREAALACITYILSRFGSVEDYYREVVVPVLEGAKSAPSLGKKWVFEYLSAGRIVHPDSYEKLKEVIMSYVKERTESGEPNIMKFEGKWDEILAYLESLDFSTGKTRVSRKKPGKSFSTESSTPE